MTVLETAGGTGPGPEEPVGRRGVEGTPAGDDGGARLAANLRAGRARRGRRRIGVVIGLLCIAVGFLLYKGLTSGIEYFKTAQQAVADRASLGHETFQIEGVVVPGSLHRSGPASQSFAICTGPVRVPVENSGSPPELFSAGVAVVLVGHFVGSGDRFSSDQILVKHSNAYVAAHPGRVRSGDGQRC